MTIMQLEILDNDDIVEKVEENRIFVRKSNGQYWVYTVNLDEQSKVIDFDVLIIKQGAGSIDTILDADLNDLKECGKE